MKLGIGGAQLGLDYGISNRIGRTAASELRNIIHAAEENGVELIDTAPAYGDSEAALGDALPPGNHFKVVTKTPRFGDENRTAEALLRRFERSLRALKRTQIYGLLFHAPADVLSPHGAELMECAQLLKSRGLVHKIGVSIYDGDEIDAIIPRFSVDIVQLPVNVFDQRLIRSGHLVALKQSGVEIHARSVFLQGLLLMGPDELNSFFAPVTNHLKAYRHAIERTGLTPTRAALKFVNSLPEVDFIICGVNDCRQFQQLIDDVKAPSAGGEDFPFNEFAFDGPDILNPSRWMF